ncbi:MAG: hypothetical protein ACRDLN_07070 [Solirubrobacteraceae bacterium]
MSDAPTQRHLSREQLQALRFAGHRQLTRWARRRDLQPRQHAQRAALICALDVLDDAIFATGCELRAVAGETPSSRA